MEDIATTAPNPNITVADIIFEINEWPDIDGALFSIAETNASPGPDELGGDHVRYHCVLHPNSLAAERIRITIEAYPIGTQPLINVGFGIGGVIQPTPSVPILTNDTVSRYEFTIVRPEDGLPLGTYLDMFQLELRDVIVTRFEATDLGVKGDLNLDQQVDSTDFGIVMSNMYESGNLGVEQGDANLDGVVDANDAGIVLEDLPE